MTKTISIAGRKIGPEYPPYVICELSGNHNGSLDRMLALVDAAADTGCDAIKIQSYTPDTITIDHDGPGFNISGGLWDGYTLHDLYKEAHTPFEWHEAIFARAKARGVTLFSSPFDESSADLLHSLGAPAYKIASFEAIDLPLIDHVARKGKPMIISTGLANLGEIEAAVSTARKAGCEELMLLHCISSYPAPSAESNLRTISHLGEAFDVVPGLSDHTLGTATSVAAVALGASVIEKHFTLARADGGPDADFSLEPDEFARLCSDCHDAWISLGQVSYRQSSAEESNSQFRRSLYVVEDIPAGAPLTRDNIRSIRPGYGLPPKHLPQVLGRQTVRTLKRGTPLDWDMISKHDGS
ncbi:pseudaminic acid synthase [Gymnodinialimonas hymeniacidonis]|uniref:pseudaminic acid synthase n=1 Tax=Gymnodinialimonas hymeniacidonis TaxID=3126508 RepID=UPI0034C6A3FC